MGRYLRLVERLLKLQDAFYVHAQDYYRQSTGKIALLRIIGIDGETMLLKNDGRRITFAEGNETPTEVFELSEDSFLDIIINPSAENFATKVALGYIFIRDGRTGEPKLTEFEKWQEGFRRLEKVLRHYVKGVLKP